MPLVDALAAALHYVCEDAGADPHAVATAILYRSDFRGALIEALTAALVEVEEEKIDPRWFYDDDSLPDDYEPPGIGCSDAAAIVGWMLPETGK